MDPCLLTDAEKETVSAELIRWPSDCNITLTGPSTSEILPYFDFGNPRFASIDHRNQQYSIYAITDTAGAVSERYAYTAYGQPTILAADGTTSLTTSAINNRYTYIRTR